MVNNDASQLRDLDLRLIGNFLDRVVGGSYTEDADDYGPPDPLVRGEMNRHVIHDTRAFRQAVEPALAHSRDFYLAEYDRAPSLILALQWYFAWFAPVEPTVQQAVEGFALPAAAATAIARRIAARMKADLGQWQAIASEWPGEMVAYWPRRQADIVVLPRTCPEQFPWLQRELTLSAGMRERLLAFAQAASADERRRAFQDGLAVMAPMRLRKHATR